MTDSDLTDPKQGPHVHFEPVDSDGRTILENSHVLLDEERMTSMAIDKIRFFTAVHASVLHPKTLHTIGLPPELAGDAEEEAEQLPSPDVLVIEQESEGNVFLYRMTRTGEPGGDTWHQSVDDAKHQAEYEYGGLLGEWRAIPDDATDAREFAVEEVGGKM